MSTYKGKNTAHYRDDDDWSEWGWDPNIGQYYRTRLNSAGGYEYEYATPQNPEVPRSEAGNAAATTNAYISDSASANTSYSEHDGYKYQSDQKYTDTGNTLSIQYVTSSYSNDKLPNKTAPYGNYQSYSSSTPNNISAGPYSTQKYKAPQGQLPITQDSQDELSGSFGHVAISPISSISQTGSALKVGVAGSTAASSSVQAPLKVEISGSNSLEVPLSNTGRRIKGTDGHSEPLDSKFRIYESKYFKPGQVFKILWSEPEGENRPNKTDVTAFSMFGRHREKVYHSIRRFIIVATSKTGSSSCVPILTYQHQGTMKKGVNRDDHAIVYTGDTPPEELPGEEKLYRDPIQVLPKTQRDKLGHDSRINYAKIYTVEHNVKVHFIGRLSPSSERKFMTAFDDTWENMNKLCG